MIEKQTTSDAHKGRRRRVRVSEKKNKHIQVKERFEAEGISIAEWARARGFNHKLVYRVLSGELKAKRGKGHEIAVALGIKGNPTQLVFRPDLAA